MTVAIDATILEDRRWTGVERYLAGLVQGLSALQPSEETVLLSRTPLALPHALPAGVRSVVTGESRLPAALWREVVMGPLAAKLGARLLHSGITAVPMLPSRTARIATVHELTWLHAEDPSRALSVHKLRVAAAAAFADRIIVNSEHTRNDVLSAYPRAQGKVRVVYPGIDPAFRPVTLAPPEAAELRQRFGIPPGPFFIFVGRIEPKKNIDGMLDALAADLPGKPSLVLIGKMMFDQQRFDSMVAERGLGGRVIRPGFVPDADLVALLSSADALLYVSQMEGFGFPPLEAMACGTPAIVSDRGAIPEVTGGAAVIVSPDDTPALAAAMHRMLTEPGYRAQLAERGRARAASFSYEAGAKALLEVYAELR
ncbi:MAG TPA: glycosyltransferase family 1 protein [Allosphingosinicella sp.]